MRSLKISVDALAISRRSAGSFVVLIGLMRELVKLCEHQFVIFSVSGDIEKELGNLGGRCKYIYTPPWTKGLLLRFFWQQFVMPKIAKKLNCELIYSSSGYPELFSKIPVVSHQQNLWSFAEHQQWWTVKNRVKSFLRKKVAEIALTKSRANVFISAYLRDCANNLFPETKGKNFTVHNAVPASDKIKVREIRTDWIDKKFCIAVGSVSIHKNYKNLLKAFSLISKDCPSLHLVIAGNYNTGYGFEVKNLCRSLNLDNKIIFAGALQLEDIFYLYKKAVFSINVSLLEAFGIPVLESLSTGCPIVCSDIPAFREIASEAAIYCNPENPDDIAEKAIQLYADEEQRKKIAAKGIEQAAKFSWNKSAGNLLEVFNKALGI